MNFAPLAAEIVSRYVSLGHPSKCQRASRLGFVTAATSLKFNGSQPNSAQCLAVCWTGALHIHFRWFLPRSRSGSLPGAKFTLRPKLALSYFGSVTARHSSSGRQPNFAALSRGCHLYSAGRPSRGALAHILVWLGNRQGSLFRLYRYVKFQEVYTAENLAED